MAKYLFSVDGGQETAHPARSNSEPRQGRRRLRWEEAPVIKVEPGDTSTREGKESPNVAETGAKKAVDPCQGGQKKKPAVSGRETIGRIEDSGEAPSVRQRNTKS